MVETETITDEQWTAAKEHFDTMRGHYQDLDGMPGVNVQLALRLVFEPMARRYNTGERTRDLYYEMMTVE